MGAFGSHGLKNRVGITPGEASERREGRRAEAEADLEFRLIRGRLKALIHSWETASNYAVSRGLLWVKV